MTSSKTVSGWILKVDDPDAVIGRSTLVNLVKSNRLSKMPPSDYIIDNSDGGLWNRNQGVFGVRNSSGGYVFVVLNARMSDADTVMTCTDYNNGTVTTYNLSKYVAELQGSSLGSSDGSVNDSSIGKRLRAIGITKEIGNLTFDDKYGSSL